MILAYLNKEYACAFSFINSEAATICTMMTDFLILASNNNLFTDYDGSKSHFTS